ncbi:hypothetical protein [Aureimonas leprariae]|uniref:Phosphatidate cytidylyltransferase n=1 Tax=Plantimonas leprariae TaxID=2615207 RepID=A0A7V7PLE3_9HYPH|nr:hypothetical protein [Aureimonas leprariae]KAB0677189.1 hypothetical protein F6X38_18880 [Aureimonas leprariae]
MTELERLVAAELGAPVRPEARAFAAHLAAGARRPPVAVLFYGSGLRAGDLDGILDFYVIVDRLADWSHGSLAARANAMLPPNVEYHEVALDGRTIRGKVAILSLRQFRRLVRTDSLDTTVWARFSQVAALAWARDEAAATTVAAAVAEAVATAVIWAVRLGPAEARPADYWRGLFRRTYASELRVEKTSRADGIVDQAEPRYERAFRAAAAAKGITLEELADGNVRPRLAETIDEKSRAERDWQRRARLAKPLNVARLAKAAFTFKGGADYIAWKVERHSGEALVVTDRERRWPLLVAVPLIRRLWRRRRRASD